jgi:hypothetical protein
MSKRNNRWSKLALVALVAGILSSANADTLQMGGSSAAADDGRPTRGMTQSSVQAKFGAPASTRAPVGDPPITRWEYPNMIVYFEYDRVIHAVMKR